MIWFFLMGMIAGVAGTIMLAKYLTNNHVTLVHYKENKDEAGDSDEDFPGY